MSALARILLGLIRVYQCTFSTVMGKQCRYHPSCSNYTAGAIRRFGAVKGGALGFSRILRCHPWRAGGYDPVPESMPDKLPGASAHKLCDK